MLIFTAYSFHENCLPSIYGILLPFRNGVAVKSI